MLVETSRWTFTSYTDYCDNWSNAEWARYAWIQTADFEEGEDSCWSGAGEEVCAEGLGVGGTGRKSKNGEGVWVLAKGRLLRSQGLFGFSVDCCQILRSDNEESPICQFPKSAALRSLTYAGWGIVCHNARGNPSSTCAGGGGVVSAFLSVTLFKNQIKITYTKIP